MPRSGKNSYHKKQKRDTSAGEDTYSRRGHGQHKAERRNRLSAVDWELQDSGWKSGSARLRLPMFD